jgi:hypothetical protein
VTTVSQGDPGAYDPYRSSSLAATASFTHNRSNAAFGTLSKKSLKLALAGEGVPGPGEYQAAHAARGLMPYVNDNHSVFASKTPQRLADTKAVPGPDHYTPNTSATYCNIRDSGASMRGSLARFQVMEHPDHAGGDSTGTDETIGPGSYNEHMHKSMASVLSKQMSRTSRLKPGFGTMSAPRKLPWDGDDSPGPGSYQPEVWSGRYSGRPRSARARFASRPTSARGEASPKPPKESRKGTPRQQHMESKAAEPRRQDADEPEVHTEVAA